MVLNQGGVKRFPGGREPLHALQHGKFRNRNVSLPNFTPVLIFHHYMLFGFFSAEMAVGIKFREILQTEFEPACRHSGTTWGLFSWHAKPL